MPRTVFLWLLTSAILKHFALCCILSFFFPFPPLLCCLSHILFFALSFHLLSPAVFLLSDLAYSWSWFRHGRDQMISAGKTALFLHIALNPAIIQLPGLQQYPSEQKGKDWETFARSASNSSSFQIVHSYTEKIDFKVNFLWYCHH